MQTTDLSQGLTDKAVTVSRAKHRRNVFITDAGGGVLATIKEVVLEPMFLLLLAACAVYSGLGRTQEAITLIVALLLVAGISVYQSIPILTGESVTAIGGQTELDRIGRASTSSNPKKRPCNGKSVVLSNMLLTLVSRSFTQSDFQTIRVPNPVLSLMLGLTFGLLLTTLSVLDVRQLFGFAPVSASALGWCVLAALLGVGWIEGYKAYRSTVLPTNGFR